ncbi:MAG: ankyrin repeat domain-containing protein [Planctomycetia bacterium]|jgi:hypothetical protein
MQLVQQRYVVTIIMRDGLLVMCAAMIGLVGCWQQDSRSLPPPERREWYADIHGAAGSGNPAAVLEFLRSGVDINGLDWHGETPLHHAVKYDKMNTVATLIQEGADVNLGTARGGDSPLYYAVMRQDWDQDWDDWDIVELLLQNGANPDQENEEGESPREYTIKQGVNDRFEAAVQKAKQNEKPTQE